MRPPNKPPLKPVLYGFALVALFFTIYASSLLNSFAWESYLWPMAIDGAISAAELYQAIYPERPPLPDFIRYYHPNHPLTHALVALAHFFVAKVSAFWTWRCLSTLAGLMLLAISFRLLLALQVPLRRAWLGTCLLGFSNAIWYESVSADVHIAAVAAISWLLFEAMRAYDQPTTISAWQTFRLGVSFFLAVGLHLNAAPAAALLGIALVVKAWREPQKRAPLIVPLVCAFIALMLVYFLPFWLAGRDVFSQQGFVHTYVLNPGHHAPAVPQALDDLVIQAVGGLARAIVPGFSWAAQLVQFLVVGSMLIAVVMAINTKQPVFGYAWLVALIGLYVVWFTVLLGQANSVVYWVYVGWLFVLAAVAGLGRSLTYAVADALILAWVLIVAVSVYSQEIRPKMAIAQTDVAFSLAVMQQLQHFDQVLVSVADPNKLMADAWQLSRQLRPGQLRVHFWLPTKPMQTLQLKSQQTWAVLATHASDPVLQAMRARGCWQEVLLYQRAAAFATNAFRFSTDWGQARAHQFNKSIYIAGFYPIASHAACVGGIVTIPG